MEETNTISPIGAHLGRLLLIAMKSYPTMHSVMLEQVQNALDAKPDNIWIFINWAKNNAQVMDDGDGVSRDDFETGTIGVSQKQKGKLGRFGLGLFCGIGKCDNFTFTSTNKSDNSDYQEWLIDTKEMINKKDLDGIPIKPRKDLIFSKKKTGTASEGKRFVNWRTRVKLNNISADRLIGRLQILDLKNDILRIYGPTIRRIKTCLHIRIVFKDGTEQKDSFTAEEYSGTKIPTKYITDEFAGEVAFKLFEVRSDKNRKKGSVVLGEKNDEFRFPIANLFRNSTHCVVDEAVNVLRSGIIEGEITAEKCKLQEKRTNFEVDDTFLGLCDAINKWYESTGKAIYEGLKEERTENRYQELGKRSMTAVAGLICSDPRFSSLIKSFKVGSIGAQHIKPDAKVNGPQDKNSKSVSGKKGNTASGKTDNKCKVIRLGPTPRPDPKKEKEHHHPITVAGPNGQKRKRVYNNSLGIQLGHEALRGTSVLWQFDRTEGLLTLNTKHPHWDACDINDTTLMKYQEFLITQALTLETMPEEWHEQIRMFSEDTVSNQVWMLLNADKLSGRGITGRKKKTLKI